MKKVELKKIFSALATGKMNTQVLLDTYEFQIGLDRTENEEFVQSLKDEINDIESAMSLMRDDGLFK